MTDATSFGKAADLYHRGRPDYPPEAVEWLLPAEARVVADVGAGTGKLTAAIAGTGRQVIAVDPDEAMLRALAEQYEGVELLPDSGDGNGPHATGELPHTGLGHNADHHHNSGRQRDLERRPAITALVGTAERLPLADRSVDAVTFAQAWHWADPDVASQEAARVLRPGGVLGLVWNIRDTNVPWVARFNAIVHHSAAERMIDADQVRIGPPLTEVERHTIAWTYRLDADTLVHLAASRSAVIALADAQRAEVLDEVRALADEQADDDGAVHLPYRTHLYRAVLRQDAHHGGQPRAGG